MLKINLKIICLFWIINISMLLQNIIDKDNEYSLWKILFILLLNLVWLGTEELIEARSSISKCCQGHAPSEGSRKIPSLC